MAKKLIIPVGPQHPALKEPASFDVTLAGEQVESILVKVGYNHRGIEKACEQKTYLNDMYLLERVCGICSHSHSTCYLQAVEEIAGLQVPLRAKYIRSIIGEMERIHSHLLWVGVAAHEIGFDTLLMYTWRDREVVMDLLALLTGNRVNYGVNVLGGVRKDISDEEKDQILKAMDVLEERTKYYAQVVTQEITIKKRLSKVGYLSPEDAVKMGAVGPTGRASGIARDVRAEEKYAAYGEADFKVITDNNCDVYARALVRVGELMEAYSIIRQLVKKLPATPLKVPAPLRIPAGEAISRYEAPRGEDLHYVRANGTDKPERVKLRAPTLANVQAVSTMLEKGYLADVTIVIAAIDPCFSCTDRMILSLNDKNSKNSQVSWKQLREESILWYKKNRGVDFSKVKLEIK
ncbi:nickel-dependent hydrogenase large subunit [Endomicrobium proavitum]|uniref:Membrane-bound hydrogenase subunit alpha NiFe-hydrogenase III large subunit n=1 Tax=Endomicrobium proavitum TaxID=1408281 RepID=A0A0G3WGD1_9BACT|nr:nickel-dependent hydrogenase large subunit [Endomicrobium proavitum]AKL97418.1 Membrane-bound hydrogenase subunit alpha NiFe-hydrogenase III large subunit [Endomicrobium proavitum]